MPVTLQARKGAGATMKTIKKFAQTVLAVMALGALVAVLVGFGLGGGFSLMLAALVIAYLLARAFTRAGRSQPTMPPSTTISVPVTTRASSEARKRAALAVSRPSPMKPSGMRARRSITR